jgi:hypothetical protein
MMQQDMLNFELEMTEKQGDLLGEENYEKFWDMNSVSFLRFIRKPKSHIRIFF